MNPDLEALLKAYDAAIEANNTADAKLRKAIFQSRLDDAIATTGLTRDTLMAGLREMYPDWLKAQRKPSALPPKA
jgi:hypothetical protein